jgi:hypothetical protein
VIRTLDQRIKRVLVRWDALYLQGLKADNIPVQQNVQQHFYCGVLFVSVASDADGGTFITSTRKYFSLFSNLASPSSTAI